jgi:hypothetical protein
MVSPQNPNPATVAPAPIRSDRGFIPEETAAVPSYPAAGSVPYVRATSFWGSVIAGTLLALSIFVLSWCLMIGCHVGVVGDTLSLGWGSAVWIAITSCIAFYCGGMMASAMGGGDLAPARAGGLKGAAVWALSIPLTFCIWGLAASGTGLFAQFTLSQSAAASTVAPATGGVMFGWFWTAFITLIVGLIFAVLGSATPSGRSRETAAAH